jgi:NAD(P)-dependent dehydrogenase (short-subunit alcohol dehydrogenase family)
VGAAVERIERDLGPIYALVNNAGIVRDAMSHRMTREQWDQVIAVQLGGAFNTVRHIIPGMRDRGRGRIVNISSRAILGNVGQLNYSAAKAGLIGFTRTLALELGPRGITANAVCPGFTETPMTASLSDEHRARVLAQTPLGRAGKPEDIANAVHFLCSDQGAYITGATLHVGGGRELGGAAF